MKKLLVLAIAAVMAIGANAQEAYNRVSVGYNSLHFSVKDVKSTDMPGFQAAYTHGFGLISSCPLYLEVGAKFALNTKKDDDGDRATIANVNIPVSIAYKFGFDNGLWVEPFVGFHGRFNVLAQEKYADGTKLNMLSKDDFPETHWNIAQIGAQMGVNVGYKMINLGFEYNANSYLKNLDTYTLSDQNWAVTVGYNF